MAAEGGAQLVLDADVLASHAYDEVQLVGEPEDDGAYDAPGAPHDWIVDGGAAGAYGYSNPEDAAMALDAGGGGGASAGDTAGATGYDAYDAPVELTTEGHADAVAYDTPSRLSDARWAAGLGLDVSKAPSSTAGGAAEAQAPAAASAAMAAAGDQAPRHATLVPRAPDARVSADTDWHEAFMACLEMPHATPEQELAAATALHKLVRGMPGAAVLCRASVANCAVPCFTGRRIRGHRGTLRAHHCGGAHCRRGPQKHPIGGRGRDCGRPEVPVAPYILQVRDG